MSFNRSGYIGRAPGDSAITISKQYFQPSGVTTDFTFSSGYDPGLIDVYRNGVKLINVLDYAATDGSTISLSTPVGVGSTVQVVAYKAYNVATVKATELDTTVTGNTINLTGDITATNATISALTTTANLNASGVVTSSTALHVGSALTANAAGDVETIGIITAASFSGSGEGLTGVASTDYIITGTAATFNNKVFVGTAITMEPGTGGGINVTGVVTATTFYGDGSQLSNVTSTTINNNADNRLISGSGTANTLNGESNLTFDGSTLAVTGAITASGAVNFDATTDSTSTSTGALIVDGGLGVAKNVYIGAGLSVAGTLTYEDVTNVDSVGMVTAKSGVNVSGGELNVGLGFSVGNAGIATATSVDIPTGGAFTVGSGITVAATSGVVTFANGSTTTNALHFGSPAELKIYHDGSNHYIRGEGDGLLSVRQMGTGDVELYSNVDARIRVNGGETAIECNMNSSVDLYHNNNKKLETTSSGVSVTGTVAATNFTGDGSALTGIEAGIGTEALITSGITTVLNLAKQDHKITATGICTITTSGGTEGDSHTIRITNSGIATVGFSSYFQFAGGASPVLTKTDGAVNLVSFTVNKTATTTGITTELLTSVANNFS